MSVLYPPIVNDTLPAFVGKELNIPYAMPIYNSEKEIKSIQISITNQSNNASVFNTKTGTYFIQPPSQNLNIADDFKYIIKNITGNFKFDQFYKIQIRFCGQHPGSNNPSINWVESHKSSFSEWSKVCLVKCITQPKLKINNFEQGNKETILASSLIELSGEFDINQSSEYLKSYNIKIFNKSNDTIVFQTDQIYTNQYKSNEIDYSIPYEFLDGVNYCLQFKYTTNNLFTQTKKFNFIIIQYGIDRLNAQIQAIPNQEKGIIQINLISTDEEPFVGNITFRRTSSKDNFSKWEDIKTITYSQARIIDTTWYDRTPESGVFYKYCAQRRNKRGDRGVIVQTDPVMCVFEDAYLLDEDSQLCLKFNTSINDFGYNVAESQQQTIGAKYPFVSRNGNNYFRSFPIGGLISSFMDESGWYTPDRIINDSGPSSFGHKQGEEMEETINTMGLFATRDSIYGTNKNRYKQYNENHNINEYQDDIYERFFREKVYDFLYKHNVKLFKSTTEGNILIKLTNIRFQPVETLGRRLYSFSANAVQIEECNISNYDKFDIQKIGIFNTDYIHYVHEINGNINQTFAAEQQVLKTINQKYKRMAREGFVNQIKYLTTLKLQIDSQPYVILEKDGRLIKATEEYNSNQIATAGYIVTINETDVIIKPSMERDQNGKIVHLGFFELKDENTIITSLKFKEPTSVSIDYVALLSEEEDISDLPLRVYYDHKPGQLYGHFKPQDSLIQKISNKYLFNYQNSYQRMLDVTGVSIEGPVGTVVYVKDSRDDDFNRHVLENGYLQLCGYDDNVFINDMYIFGVHLNESPLNNNEKPEIFTINGLKLDNFNYKQGIYTSLDEIENPENGDVYNITVSSTLAEKYREMVQNTTIYILNESGDNTQVTQEILQSLVYQDTINETMKFVYFYGCWYILPKGYAKTGFIKGDIRNIRDGEFVEIHQQYDSLEDIVNPIPNGVYKVPTYYVDNAEAYDEERDLLTVPQSQVFIPQQQSDDPYILKVSRILEESDNKYIYYQGHWRQFTANHDVICPVDVIVNYFYEVMKGVK